MRLETQTWLEVEAYLKRSPGIFLPVGSTEQHGPVGLIGTDAICAREIARAAADRVDALVAPELAYTPAPFNMAFPGTVSVSVELFERMAREVVQALSQHGFKKVFILNGHGANLDPLRRVADGLDVVDLRIRSWWDYKAVNVLRQEYYGDWEGMHATPSEVAITQQTHRVVLDDTLPPPERLTPEYIKSHVGDRHGPPDAHRRDFPDGRVGSHSALARPEHGAALLAAASNAVAEDYLSFVKA